MNEVNERKQEVFEHKYNQMGEKIGNCKENLN